jgi:bifunctional DNA-binding transcriptional regulator/antitoxin component of YhaV-PrlF toxin-antitoxin module
VTLTFPLIKVIVKKEINMITNAIEFNAKIDADWKISIPVEYRKNLSSSPRVILLLKNDNDMHELLKASESSLAFWDNEDDKVWDNV